MGRRSAPAALNLMDDRDDKILDRATDWFGRRLSDECGTLRVETANLRADMNNGFGDVRADMIERNAGLIKWNAAFWVAQLAAIAALLVLMR